MSTSVPLIELQNRMERFRAVLEHSNPDWQMIALFGRVNQYYFTGTLQDGVLLIPREGEAVYWVRRSYDRALNESDFPLIQPMNSFRDIAASLEKLPESVHLETEIIPLALLERFKKYFPAAEIKPVDLQVSAVRAIKSFYELAIMERTGRMHQRILEEAVPRLLKEGMSEADLAGEIYPMMLAEGHQGVSRSAMFQSELGMGLFCFGESSLYPTSFDGPGGNYGLSPSVPLIGSRQRKLRKGDLVFIDTALGMEGYHTDKTLIYAFGAALSKEALAVHHRCVDIQLEIAAMLKPGAIPSEIYNSIMSGLDDDFLENFMGYGNRQARFLGHGIGLHVDELPVIAKGFDEPLQEGMVLAVEPKKGVAGVGMVGIENTYVVTADGGRCLTGTNPGPLSIF